MKALVVAGGVPQVELLRNLKRRNIKSVLVDGNANCLAKPFADIFHQVQIFDIDAVKDIAIKEKVDFVITVCADQVLLVAAEVSELLGMPCYIDFKTAKDVSDKIRMKKIFKEHDIPTTDYVQSDAIDLDKPEELGLRYPLVVKPVDVYSSKGVRKVESPAELKTFYQEAARISRSGRVIVEEFFEGDEISVDAFVENGKARVLTVTNSEKVKDKNRFVIFRGIYPVQTSEVVLRKIENIAQKIADAFGLVNSPLLIQLLSNGDNVSVLEFCARTGGNMKYLLIKHSCGVDVIDATLAVTLGQKPDLDLRDTGNNVVVNDFIYCHPGTFDHFEGFDDMVKAGYITEFCPNRAKGTVMYGVTSSGDRIAGMTIVANSIAEYNEKKNRILRSVKVVSADGRDIMRRDLLPDLQ